MVIFYTLLISSTLAIHDHRMHESIEYMTKEGLKASHMPFNRLIQDIENRKADLAKLKNKWKIDIEARPKGEEGYWKIWEEYYAPIYQEMTDRFLVYTHVCEYMYDGNEECHHKDNWEDKYDGRGVEFRKEFIEELRNLIDEKIGQLKEERMSKGEL